MFKIYHVHMFWNEISCHAIKQFNEDYFYIQILNQSNDEVYALFKEITELISF